MVNSLFCITNKEIHIDSLIIEPMFSCAHNCEGCYTRAHKKQGRQIKDLEWWILIAKFLNRHNENFSVNQLSISVNDPVDFNDIKTMDSILACIDDIKHWNVKKETQVHATLFSPSTINLYAPLTKWFSNLDSIYFSNIKENEIEIIQELRRLNPKIEIGWNARLIYDQTVPKWIDAVDAIYWIMNKTEESYYPAYYPRANQMKTITDVCDDDYWKWKSTGKSTCPANISKFTVWPDGSVSGCPYAKTSNTGPASTVDGVLANIVEASKSYDFDNCPMKRIYK